MTASPLEPSARSSASTLTEWLRGRSDAELAELLRRRPDLALPAPADLPTLAGRLGVRTSVQRAVDGLNAFVLRLLEALVLAADGEQRSSVEAATRLLDSDDSGAVDAALAELRALALVWGGGDHVHLAASVRESLGAYPAGLGRAAATLLRQVPDASLAPVLRTLGLPPATQPQAGAAVADVLADPERVRAMIADCDQPQRDILYRLAAGPPVGVVRPRPGETPPAVALVMRGLLVALDGQTVELPREVGLQLRERPLGGVAVEPPPIEVAERAPAELDRLGTTAVLEAVRLVDALADAWTAHPPAQLRSGGIGVRELRRTARELGTDETTVALVAEVAVSAGLLNSTHSLEPVYLPTEEFDSWRRQGTATRWADLALTWLAMTRQPSLIGQRGERDRMITLLSPDAERGTAPALRSHVLDTLAELAPGHAPRAVDEVLAHLAWREPRRASNQRPALTAILAEADRLGITAAGGLTGYSRTLRSGSRAVAEQVLTGALPDPVDHFLVQPDLTIVVPGPPTAELGAELALTADLESTGGASVYRITEASVRRALDAGRTGAQIAALIAQRSRTPVPQSLSYLIDDLARRHGTLRSGVASSYLRCEDEALLARVLSDRAAAPLQLRRIAPSVVISPASVGDVLDVLREAGYAPAAESPEGEVIALGIEPPRAPARQPVRSVRPRTDVVANLAEIVKRIRSGDALTEMTTRQTPASRLAQQVPGVTSAATMGMLREAIRAERTVLIGVAESDGTAGRHLLVPISMAGGFVRGHQPGRDGLVSFPLHRISAATIVDDGDGADDG